MALINCPECAKEISDKAKSCPNCGCPLQKQVKIEDLKENNSFEPRNTASTLKKQIIKPKFLVSIVSVFVVLLVIGVIYNGKVIQPKKIEERNAKTYTEAVGLLENGKYEDGQKLLETISEYKDVSTILEQIKWESRVYECITDIRQYLKNPDTLQVYEVVFYDGYKKDISDRVKNAMESAIKLTGNQPVCVMHRGGQNGFGGNTTGYSLFLYSESDKAYKYLGSCDSLNEDDIDDDNKEKKVTSGLINIYKDNLNQVGNVDLSRIKTIIKNDSYSAIKVIE